MKSPVTMTIPVKTEELVSEPCWTITVPVLRVILEPTVKVRNEENYTFRTYNYYKAQGCQLLPVDYCISCRISQTDSFNNSDEIPCNHDNPCQNGGTCSGTVLSYQCSCTEGHTGTNCEGKLFELFLFQSLSSD